PARYILQTRRPCPDQLRHAPMAIGVGIHAAIKPGDASPTCPLDELVVVLGDFGAELWVLLPGVEGGAADADALGDRGVREAILSQQHSCLCRGLTPGEWPVRCSFLFNVGQSTTSRTVTNTLARSYVQYSRTPAEEKT